MKFKINYTGAQKGQALLCLIEGGLIDSAVLNVRTLVSKIILNIENFRENHRMKFENFGEINQINFEEKEKSIIFAQKFVMDTDRIFKRKIYDRLLKC